MVCMNVYINCFRKSRKLISESCKTKQEAQTITKILTTTNKPYNLEALANKVTFKVQQIHENSKMLYLQKLLQVTQPEVNTTKIRRRIFKR